MTIYFEENNKLFGISGILNRRNFIINLFIILAISSIIFETPVTWYFISDPSTFIDIAFDNGELPSWIKTCAFLSNILVWGCLYPSVLRRMRDIIGQNDENKIYFHTAILYIIIIFSIFSSNVVIKSLDYSILIILMCLEGAVSRTKPKDSIIKFNWGAFIGAWLWGIINKLPKTLYAIPLMLTPAWFYIQVLFGLKGNEWSYNSTKPNTTQEFHKKQSKQAIYLCFIVPILSAVFFLISLMFSVPYIKTRLHESPDLYEKVNSAIIKVQSTQAQEDFSQIETENENEEFHFYIDPKDWESLSESGKISKFNNAVAYVSKNKNLKPNEAIKKIKIYSNYNNEILCEYSSNGLKFNEYPSVP